MIKSPDRVMSSYARKNLTRRLTKWAGFEHDFAGNLTSKKWSGYKMMTNRGELIVHLWKTRHE